LVIGANGAAGGGAAVAGARVEVVVEIGVLGR